MCIPVLCIHMCSSESEHACLYSIVFIEFNCMKTIYSGAKAKQRMNINEHSPDANTVACVHACVACICGSMHMSTCWPLCVGSVCVSRVRKHA